MKSSEIQMTWKYLKLGTMVILKALETLSWNLVRMIMMMKNNIVFVK